MIGKILLLSLLCILKVKGTVFLEFEPKELRININQNGDVSYRIIKNDSSQYANISYEVDITGTEPKVFVISPETRHQFISCSELDKYHNFKVEAKEVPGSGFSLLNISIVEDGNTTEFSEFEYSITVSEKEHLAITSVLKFVIGIVIAISYVNFGFQLELKAVGEVFKKPVGPAVVLLCQFLAMPLLSFGIGYALVPDQYAMRLGLFVVGCCPAGSTSNLMTMAFGGDMNLSITSTLISSLIAIVTLPLWLLTMGHLITDTITIPFLTIFFSVLGLTAPILVGVTLRWLRPQWKETFQKVMRVILIILLVVVIIVACFTGTYIFPLYTWSLVFAAALLVTCGFLCGFILSYFLRMPRNKVIAITLESGIQNGATAIVVVTLSLDDSSDAIAAVLPVSAQQLFTTVPLLLVLLGFKIRHFFLERKRKLMLLRESDHLLSDEEDTVLYHKEESKVQLKKSDQDQPTENGISNI